MGSPLVYLGGKASKILQRVTCQIFVPLVLVTCKCEKVNLVFSFVRYCSSFQKEETASHLHAMEDPGSGSRADCVTWLLHSLQGPPALGANTGSSSITSLNSWYFWHKYILRLLWKDSVGIRT